MEEPLGLVQPLIGLWVWRVRDVFQVANDSRHVVHWVGEAEATGSPCASVIVVMERVRGLLLCKVLSLVLELCLGGLQVYLLSS